MRRILAATVVVWSVVAAARCAIGALGADYWDPVATLDYAAIWTYSAVLGLSAAIALLVTWFVRSDRRVLVAGSVAGAGFAITGVANGIEDGFDVPSLGTVYVVAVLVGLLGQIVLAVVLRVAGAGLLAGLAALVLAPLILQASWAGVLVVVPAAWIAWRLWRSSSWRAVVEEAPVPA